MGSLDSLLDAQRIAVIGVAKNCGKTTTLNFLMELYALQVSAEPLAVCSVGIDGESADLLIGTPKPPVRVVSGIWCVSVESAFDQSDARVEFVEDLGIETPLGRLVIARVLQGGDVILAGVRHRADLHTIRDRLAAHGVQRVVVDGAYGRIAAAHADVVDAVIISTGAIVHRRPDQVIARTRELVERLTLPEVESEWQTELLEASLRDDRALLGGPKIAPIELEALSALVALPKSRHLWTRDVEAIAIPGLVSDRVLESLIKVGSGRTLLIPDGTSLQTDAARLSRFRKSWRLRVGHSQRVLGISVNPTSIGGWSLPEGPLLASMRAIWPEITIFNPIHGIHSGS